MPPPFADGWKAAELRCVATTNVQEMTVPLETVYAQFKPRQGATDSGDLERQFELVIKVNSIGFELGYPIAAPKTKGITLLEERRIAGSHGSSNAVVYASQANILPSEPEEQALQRMRKLDPDRTALSSPFGRVLMVGVVFVSGVLLLVFLVKRNQK